MTDLAAMLADTVARVVGDHQVADPWRPGSSSDDALSADASELGRLLGQIGWAGLLDDEPEPSVVAVVCVELGRGLVSLRHIDALLGGSPLVAGLGRHVEAGDRAVRIEPGEGLVEVYVDEARPVAYGDASGVARVMAATSIREVPDVEAERRLQAWRAGSIGYLAGLAGSAFEDCLEHVRSRFAFGATLDARESVQAHLADAATALEGTRLLVGEEHSWAALSYAAASAVRITAICHQLTGALGYTLEYPLQRRSRRARAMATWAEACAEAAEACAEVAEACAEAAEASAEVAEAPAGTSAQARADAADPHR